MSIAAVAHRHVFGLKGDVKNNIFYVEEQNVLYPAGNNAIIYNTETKTQKFLSIAELNETIIAMSLSQNKKLLAVALRCEKLSISIYDVQTQRKRKVIPITDVDSKDIVDLTFSPDAKLLLVQTGSPDWALHYCSLEKGKALAVLRIGAQMAVQIHEVSFNPFDNSLVCVSGNGILKIFRFSDNTLKQISFKAELKNYLCHTWLSENRLAAGTEDSRILFFEDAEMKGEFVVTVGPTNVSRSIVSLLPFSKGLICGTSGGSLVVFEKTDETKDWYRKIKDFVFSDEASRVTNLALSPNEDSLLCSLTNNQIFYISFGSIEMIKSDEARFELLSQPFHSGQISGMDVCVRKPLLATCGSDKFVCIWNFMENTNELTKLFAEEPFSVAIHPSGLYVLVGFSDKLKLMNLLIDDMRVFREFSIRGCREVRFSNGGQYFAAANGNTIQVYNVWTFENIGNLKGHNGKIRSLAWSADDNKLVSAGTDGAVYEWIVQDFRRQSECIVKACAYSSAIFSPDNRSIYAVGTDRMFKEISDSQIVRDVPMTEVVTQILLSHSGRMLFAGTLSGSIRSLRFPILTDVCEFQEHIGHSSPVTRLRISLDDQYLFSAGEDGTIYIYKTTDREAKMTKREREIEYADEILVTKSDLEEKHNLMNDLKAKVEELKMENEYQLRLKDLNFNDKTKEVTERFLSEIDTLKITSNTLRNEKEREEVRHQQEINSENERHAKEMQELEVVYSAKLMAEYDKYQELQNRTSETQLQWENQLREMDESRERALTELTDHFEERLKEKQLEIDRLQEDMRHQIREFEEMARETEEDADNEVMELRHRYERKLREEKENGLQLKGENSLMKKKFNSLQSEIEAHKVDIQRLVSEEKKLHNIIKALEKDIIGLKKEIQERDETIQDKEKRIYDLKKKNQELEKFKFVLDYKIKELKHQIEPRENEILTMTKQITEMDNELEQYHQTNTKLELAISDLKQKLKAAEQEVNAERSEVIEASQLVKRFKVELTQCVDHIQDPKQLKAGLKVLYHKYCKDLVREAGLDADIQKEYTRQRDYLERSVNSLKQKMNKDQVRHRVDNSRIITENISLIKEINQLRRDLKSIKLQEKELENAVKEEEDTQEKKRATENEQGKLPEIPSSPTATHDVKLNTAIINI